VAYLSIYLTNPDAGRNINFVKSLAKASRQELLLLVGGASAMSASQTVLPEKATHQQTRTFNQQLVLRALHDHSPQSRADLARLTGLTRTSVSDLVGSLIDDDLIEEIGRGRSSGGKSPILLRVAPDGRHLIGLDLGEAQFSGAVVNLSGDILRSIHLPLEGRNGEAALDLVFELLDALRADDRPPLLGIGIGAPGVIDTRTGTVRWSVNLDWAELRLGPLVESRYDVPVVVANDSHAAALAELTFHRRPRPNNLIVIKVGRGIGAGIILNGQLFQGDGYGAGEFGHVSPGHVGAACRCGREGCLETVTSMRALVDAAQAVDPTVSDEAGLVAAFRTGVDSVRRIVLDAARELGLAVGWLIGVLNVDHVLVVGPVAEFGDDWLGEVQRSARSSVLELLARDTQIEFGHVHDDVVVLGASALPMAQPLGPGLVR
jgi:predicted NBD/HSP70 family sugar kinase